MRKRLNNLHIIGSLIWRSLATYIITQVGVYYYPMYYLVFNDVQMYSLVIYMTISDLLSQKK